MTNKSARLALEAIYGKGCMFQKAYIAKKIEQIGGIKTYKTFVEEKHYKLKKIKSLERTMTYHHLKHEADGGRATVRNGAIVNELAHQYLHSLPRDEEEIINNMLRQYKYEFEMRGGLMIPTDNGLEMQQPFSIDLGFDIGDDYISIPVYDNTKEDMEKRQKFNRAKVKRDFQRQVEEELDWYENGDECEER